MTDTEIYAHYHRTAPVEDLRFFLRHAELAADVRRSAEALLAIGCRDTGGQLPRAAFYRQFTALQDRWRKAAADVPTQAIADVERGAA